MLTVTPSAVRFLAALFKDKSPTPLRIFYAAGG